MQYSRKSNLLPIGLMLVSLFGCGASGDLHAGASKFDKEDLKIINSPMVSGSKVVATSMTKEEQVVSAKTQLVKMVGVDFDSIEVAGVESVRWSSGAMGCPKPGMMYTQALVPGVLVMLKAEGQAYRYHSSVDGAPFYCPNTQAESPSASPSEI